MRSGKEGTCPMSLKNFIKAVRQTKTIADERAIVQKESAAIRTSFREEPTGYTRQQNILKLLYLFTLGERTHFGQIECVKLLASPRFSDKRLGYLGTMLLLDENQEVLTLVTNSMQKDLHHANQYIAGLALCTLGNIASPEMSRDLFHEVEKLMGSTNPYLRKKAVLCAMRVIRKVPDFQENFIDRAKLLLSDRNHGVLLSALTLVTDICEQDPDAVEYFKVTTPILVRHLKSLSSSGYEPEYDVGGIADPFIQIKILQLLRVFAKHDSSIVDQINDILAQVATNTESTKNVGNAILYEAVLTILEIDSESGLRILGINILGKFLTNKDNNIRYVALNTLNKVIASEPNAVQRHRNTILECLADPDISIRRRALELSFALINENNIRVLVRELLVFLETADTEFKPAMTTQICIAADRFAPNKRWHIDTVIRTLKLAGKYIREEILSTCIRLIAQTPELQTYATQRLYVAVGNDKSQDGLVLTAIWAIGEYGDSLISAGVIEEEGETPVTVTESSLLDLLESIRSSPAASSVIHEYMMTTYVKLTARMKNQTEISKIRSILSHNTNSPNIEIQQRAVEYHSLFNFQDIRQGVLEHMPAPDIKAENRVLGAATSATINGSLRSKRVHRPKASEKDVLLDLMGGANEATTAPSTNSDLLANLMDAPAATETKPSNSKVSELLGLFGNTSVSAVPLEETIMLTAYHKNDLLITISASNSLPIAGTVDLTTSLKNESLTTSISHIQIQAAVPKTQKLHMQSLSSSTLSPGAEATQLMKCVATRGVRIFCVTLLTV